MRQTHQNSLKKYKNLHIFFYACTKKGIRSTDITSVTLKTDKKVAKSAHCDPGKNNFWQKLRLGLHRGAALPHGMKNRVKKRRGEYTVFPLFPKVLGVFNCVLSCCRTSSAGSPLSYSSTVPMAGRGSILTTIRQTTNFLDLALKRQ
jgi:hypothetical protein